MPERYTLLFREKIKDELNKLHSKKDITALLNKLFDKLEILGPLAGNLIDTKRSLYEIKMKRPPIRLYFQAIEQKKQVLIFEFEMKTSKEKQQKTIDKLKKEIDSSEF